MFEMLEDFIGTSDKQLKVLLSVHNIVCFYNAGFKIKYKYVKPKLDQTLEIIRAANANGEIESWPENKRQLGKQVLLLEKEIKSSDYLLSQQVLQLHYRIERQIFS